MFNKHPIIEQEDIGLVKAVLESGQLSGFKANQSAHLGGEWVRAFEDEFKNYHNIKHAIAFNSATSALHAALIACGIGTGDEVIASPFTFSASASCIKMAGADAAFADIEDTTFCIDPLEAVIALSQRTKAIIPVHLMGHPADMDGIRAFADLHRLKIIEDACQSLGAEYKGEQVGTMGDCGVFSFNQSKPISSGEGGILITNDGEIARIARAVRNHGEVSDPELGILGYNYRMCEIEALLGLTQFKKLDLRNDTRIILANHLTERLNDIDGLTPPYVIPDCKHVYYTYGVKVDEDKIGMTKQDLQKRLIAKGIYFGSGNQRPLHLYPFYGGHEGQLPVAERISRELMFTDILRYPMTIEDVDKIIGAIHEIIQGQV